jgi:hypothetical protein
VCKPRLKWQRRRQQHLEPLDLTPLL